MWAESGCEENLGRRKSSGEKCHPGAFWDNNPETLRVLLLAKALLTGAVVGLRFLPRLPNIDLCRLGVRFYFRLYPPHPHLCHLCFVC
jgi:hypothetical protein